MQHFTVIVPTRNRADTLQWCVRSCLAQDYENMTLLVSNNSSVDGTEDLLASFSDPRLKVIKTPAPTSMTGNVEFALEHVLDQDTYVTCIGDDDGMLPGGLKHANELLEKHGQVGAITWKTSNYNWPDCLVPEWRNVLLLSRSEHSALLDAGVMLAKTAEYGVYYHDLPGLWTSLVATTELRRCKERLGTLMISMHPDTGSAVMLACMMEKYIYTFRGVTFLGSSGHSNGLAFALQQKSKMEMFLSANTIPPHPEAVLAPHGVYYVTESLLQARDRGILPSGIKIDLPRAVRLMTVRNPADRPEVYERICQSAAATAAMHRIPFDLDEMKRINEELNEKDRLMRDPVILEHERWFSHTCDPSLTSNIYSATILAGELMSMLRNSEIVTQEDHVGILSARQKLHDDHTRATEAKTNLRISDYEALIALLQKNITSQDSKVAALRDKLEQSKNRADKYKEKFDKAKSELHRRKGFFERLRNVFHSGAKN